MNYVEPVLTEFLKRLDKANVPYEVIEYGDLDIQPGENDGLAIEWVVWPLVWSPLLIFELALALWLIIKGVAEPAPRQDEVGGRASRVARATDA